MRARMVTALLALASASAGCGGDGGGEKADLAVKDLAMTTGDLAGAGAVGSPCSDDGQCHEGTTPVCWQRTFENLSDKIATPDGYCSSACTDDTDCGTGLCIDFGSDGKWCTSPCAAATDCRTGYSCFTYAGDHCFPSGNLSCDPTSGDGTCTGRTPEPGGCLRSALGPGDTGFCLDGCIPGVGTCPPIGGQLRQCDVYVYAGDSAGDKFKGPVCGNAYSANAIGSECKYNGGDYVDACVDGAACYLSNVHSSGDNLCHALCVPGAVDGGTKCATGTCTDVWGLFGSSNPAGLCL